MAIKFHLGVFFIFIISSFYHTEGNDIEQHDTKRFGSTILEKYEGIIQTNTSDMSSGHFRMRSRRQVGRGSCEGCGFANIEREIRTSIIQGDDVSPPYKYPWTVAIKTNGKISCTGSILNEFFILTAAHCFKRDVHKYEALKPTGKRVPYLSASEVSIEILKRDGPPVERIIPHSRFSVSQWRNDIALLQLKERIPCNRYTSPICLPPRNFAFPRRAVLTIAGFGSDLGQGEAIDHLKEAKVRQVGYNACPFPSHLKDGTYYCVKGSNYRQTLCYGDSGGPMIYRRGNKFYQFGVASFGKQCELGEPFLYTSIPRHLNWIYRNMGSFRGSAYLSDEGAGGEAAAEEDYGVGLDYGEGPDYGETVDYEGAGGEIDITAPEAEVTDAEPGAEPDEPVASGMAVSEDLDGNYAQSKVSRPKKCRSKIWSNYFPDDIGGGYS